MADEKEMMSMSELTKLICGEMEFTFTIKDKLEMTLVELNQKELVEIDNEMISRGLKPDNYSPGYMSTLKVLKLVKAFKRLTNDGLAIDIDKTKMEELLWALGEGTIAGLYFKYEGTIADKFNQVQKKN